MIASDGTKSAYFQGQPHTSREIMATNTWAPLHALTARATSEYIKLGLCRAASRSAFCVVTALATILGVAGFAHPAGAVNLSSNGLGQVLIYPYYTVNTH